MPQRNVISGNAKGIEIEAGASQNTVEGNYIGTDKDGTGEVPNGIGVAILDSNQNKIIGKNVISGNRLPIAAPLNGDILQTAGPGLPANGGVLIQGNSMVNTVAGNYIGLDAIGLRSVVDDPTHGYFWGVMILGDGASYNSIGGLQPDQHNVISGNTVGVQIQGPASNNFVRGNFIGTDTLVLRRCRQRAWCRHPRFARELYRRPPISVR